MEINVKEMREAQKKFQSLAHFLAMAKLKQAWLCPSGLTKMLFYSHCYLLFKLVAN
ncbi:MAG: hypothetical protein SPF96_04180 [Prevotella sp.]|nr:hypothetical protein [Prevotella sp.]